MTKLNKEEMTTKSWEALKKVLLATQAQFEDRNGLDYCKNCGTDFRELIKDIDLLFQQQKEESYNKGLADGKAEEGIKCFNHVKEAKEEIVKVAEGMKKYDMTNICECGREVEFSGIGYNQAIDDFINTIKN